MKKVARKLTKKLTKKKAVKKKTVTLQRENKGDRNAKGQFEPGNTLGWEPGQSGNILGRPEGSVSIMKVIREVLNNEKDGKKRLDKIAEVMIQAAEAGDFRFYQELLNRLEGKVADRIVAGDVSPLSGKTDAELDEIIAAGSKED